MKDVVFASGNANKYSEVRQLLAEFGINCTFGRIEFVEIQSDMLEKIAIHKSINAFEIIKSPLIVEDDGLFVEKLGGFPGPYSSYIFKTLGNNGIIKLLEGSSDRSAFFKSVIVYNDGEIIRTFHGQVQGSISTVCLGGGWGFDPIFSPLSQNGTFGQLHDRGYKSDYSHRSKAIKLFAEWYEGL